MDQTDHIITGVDKLLSLVKEREELSLTNAARELKVSKGAVLQWAETLEDSKQIVVKHTLKETFLMSKEFLDVFCIFLFNRFENFLYLVGLQVCKKVGCLIRRHSLYNLRGIVLIKAVDDSFLNSGVKFVQCVGSNVRVKFVKEGNPLVKRRLAYNVGNVSRMQCGKHLAGHSLAGTDAQPVKNCGPEAPPSDLDSVTTIADWGVTPQNTRFIAADSAQLQASDVPRLGLKWAFAYPGATRARSQPVVAGNTVFVGSQDGTIYALDIGSGC